MHSTRIRQLTSLLIALSGSIAIWVVFHQELSGEYSSDPGPILLPGLAVGLIVAFSIYDLLVQVIPGGWFRISVTGQNGGAGEAEPEELQMGGAQFLAIVLVSVAMTLFAMFLPSLGYLICGFILVSALMFALGGSHYFKILLISAGVVAALNVTMIYGFGSPIPTWPNLSTLPFWGNG